MELLMSPASPFVRKARVVIRETGLPVTERAVTTTPLATDPALAAANPMGKIPALLREDGPALFDSRVICRFLNDQAQAALYPEARLWDVLTLEAVGDGISDAAVAMTYETRFRSAEMVSQDWLDGQWAKVDRTLTAIEGRWMGLLTGPLHIGQISVACGLGYLDLRHGDRGWRAAHPTLAAWADEIFARPSMVDTDPA